MIRGYFHKVDGIIKSIEISGHAEFDESGRDIVCAAVSTAIIVTANAIELLKMNSKRSLSIEEGYFKIEVIKHHEIIDALLTNLEYTLYDLEQQYPKYINNQKEG